MNTYEIRITNTNDDNNFQTFTVKAEDITTLTNNLEEAANYSGSVELELVDGTFLECDQNSEHGYNANLYESKKAFENGDDPIGGGLCTGTLSDAIEMALTNQ
jgi:hypothetical protein